MSTAVAEVTLQQLLQSREQRAQSQRTLLHAYGRPLLSITLVTPGPIKDSDRTRKLMKHALRALDELIERRAWQQLHREVRYAATGPEALLVIDAEAESLKLATIELEDNHPLGRLWDIDVLRRTGVAASRATVGHAPRRCLLCAEDAHLCVRSRAHSLAQVEQAVEAILNGHC